MFDVKDFKVNHFESGKVGISVLSVGEYAKFLNWLYANDLSDLKLFKDVAILGQGKPEHQEIGVYYYSPEGKERKVLGVISINDACSDRIDGKDLRSIVLNERVIQVALSEANIYLLSPVLVGESSKHDIICLTDKANAVEIDENMVTSSGDQIDSVFSVSEGYFRVLANIYADFIDVETAVISEIPEKYGLVPHWVRSEADKLTLEISKLEKELRDKKELRESLIK